MININIPELVEVAVSDPEFSREIRYFNGILKLAIESDEFSIKFDDGKLVSVENRSVPDEECKIFVKGTAEHWGKMLEPYPVPFYQCFQTTAVKHGLVLSSTNETFAY
ncbi:hypothetical protein GCM10011348_03070 [Marinobacterium nitratireducens]|uniref:Uncharacterized protein n=1 Tax=Marinobacterium nitratireducens TaxID=518897 RepID=A0A917Z6R8_9GAMM|nr:hypothetical protein [Marinobacterium nitratireducens]GGO76269.1 hypothetical protein GCM10011348_03070 [Marinobacterium nitratireducens]